MSDPNPSTPNTTNRARTSVIVVVVMAVLILLGIWVNGLVKSRVSTTQDEILDAVMESYPTFCPRDQIEVSEFPTAFVAQNPAWGREPHRYWDIKCRKHQPAGAVGATIDLLRCTAVKPMIMGLTYAAPYYAAFHSYDGSPMAFCPTYH